MLRFITLFILGTLSQAFASGVELVPSARLAVAPITNQVINPALVSARSSQYFSQTHSALAAPIAPVAPAVPVVPAAPVAPIAVPASASVSTFTRYAAPLTAAVSAVPLTAAVPAARLVAAPQPVVASQFLTRAAPLLAAPQPFLPPALPVARAPLLAAPQPLLAKAAPLIASAPIVRTYSAAPIAPFAAPVTLARSPVAAFAPLQPAVTPVATGPVAAPAPVAPATPTADDSIEIESARLRSLPQAQRKQSAPQLARFSSQQNFEQVQPQQRQLSRSQNERLASAPAGSSSTNNFPPQSLYRTPQFQAQLQNLARIQQTTAAATAGVGSIESRSGPQPQQQQQQQQSQQPQSEGYYN